MKHTINLFVVLQLTLGIAYGQNYRDDLCTPKGSNVVAWSVSSEHSDSLKSCYDSYFSSTYNQKFNCHSCAWHVSDGGNERSIGYDPWNTDEYIYWQDGSDVLRKICRLGNILFI